MNTKMLAAATALIGATLGMAQPALAVTDSKTLFLDPSTACQLSIPTTDTAVRPKATGYRNEGANAFVICGTGQLAGGGAPTSMSIQMLAFDGASHDVSCTAVNRQSSGSGPVYSTKVGTVDGSGGIIEWLPADVNSFGGFASSMTCILPSGVSITGTRLVFPVEIGS